MSDLPIALSSPRPTPPPVPAAPPPSLAGYVREYGAIESARTLLGNANRPGFSPSEAREVAAELRTFAAHAPAPLAAQLEQEASELDRAAASADVTRLVNEQRPAVRSRQHNEAVQLLDALLDQHVVPGRAAAEVMTYVLRDVGQEGVLQLAGRVSMHDFTQAAVRHGATATEAHLLAERFVGNAGEAYHQALLERVVSGLSQRLTEVRAAGAPRQLDETVEAVLRGGMSLTPQLSAVGRAREAGQLTALAQRYQSASPSEQLGIREEARELVARGLADLEAVLAQQAELVSRHLSVDSAMELPRFFPQQATEVAREAGLTPAAANALLSGRGSTLLERAMQARFEAARRVRVEQDMSRATLNLASDALGWFPIDRASEVAVQGVLRTAEASAAARDRGMLVGAFLVANPLSR